MNRKNDNSGVIAVLIVIGIFLFVHLIVDDSEPECIKYGCDNDRASGSSYCYLHKSYAGGSSYKSTTSDYSSGSSSLNNSYSDSGSLKNDSSGSDSSKNGTSGYVTSGTSSIGSGKKKPTYSYNPYSSYDEGYEDVYDGDDYDWDRYWEDDDYASGVDDAMEDIDW